ATNRSGDGTLESLARDRRGVVVLYPVVEEKPPPVSPTGAIAPEHLVMAFGLVAPGSSSAPKKNLVRFRTVDSTRGDFAIVERGADGS
ncbi:hypothetical protein ACZ90_16650, partial [Streptomyces albus subsp. albus]